MSYTFNPPPGWDVPAGFTPDGDWKPDPAWPAAPQGWQFWTQEQETASAKVSGFLRSLKTKATDEDWMGKAKTAATQATTQAQQLAGQAGEKTRQMDQASLDKAGPMPQGALWRGISHEAGRNAIITLYPDRIERTKPTSRMSVTGMLTGGHEDVEVIPTKSISSVQVKRGPWYHDLTVYASGNTIVLSLDAAQAEQLRGLIMAQVVGGAPPAPAQPAGPSIPEQIKQLGELRDAGLISGEEFETKKSDLLARM